MLGDSSRLSGDSERDLGQASKHSGRYTEDPRQANENCKSAEDVATQEFWPVEGAMGYSEHSTLKSGESTGDKNVVSKRDELQEVPEKQGPRASSDAEN
jgi:hypothetical protein